MGKRDRERIERIQQGKEQPISNRALRNPVARTALKLAGRKGVVEELSRGSVNEQTERLGELVGTGILGGERLKKALMNKAPKEMDKAIRKFQKQKRDITVDSLLADTRSEPGFLKMCENIGLNLDWFEELARERMKKHGITEG